MLASRSMRACRALLLATCMLLAAAAVAAADVEPNDVISQAEGPIAGGTPIVGSLSSANDVDYYYFYVQGQQQIHLRSLVASDTSGDPCYFWLEDADGTKLPPDYTTPPGLNRYFIHVENVDDFLCTPPPATYSLQVDPAAAVVSGPALDRSFVQTGEPNESPAQAIGPLAGGVNYRGSIDTSNDQDWFYFFVAPGPHQVDVSVTDPVHGDACAAEVNLAELDNGDVPSSATADSTTYGHVRATLTGPAVYHLQASSADYCGSPGSSWQFRIEPPDALTPSLETPPPPTTTPPKPQISHACKLARSRVHAWSRRVRTLTTQLHHAHGAHSRHVLRVYLKAARRHLASAVAQRRRHCPGGR